MRLRGRISGARAGQRLRQQAEPISAMDGRIYLPLAVYYVEESGSGRPE
jgi:hypothetical protein